jgi:hypothetical protein
MLNICTKCGYVQRELVCLLLPTSSVKNNIELKCWKEDGIREDISKVVINLESDNESDSESNDDDSSDGDETEDYEWP